MQPSHGKAALFGIEIDRVSMPQALDVIGNWFRDVRSPCRYVVTPNVNHVVQLQKNVLLRQAYSQAAMVVADGWPLVTAARLLGKALPERVPGSDLVPQLFARVDRVDPLRTYLLGGAAGVAKRAAIRIEQKWPGVRVVGTDSPPPGFENDPQRCQRILQSVAAANTQLLVVGLGAPKQEIWIQKHQHQLAAQVAIAAGATIDFLAGEQSRAPRWIQQMRLEWFYRIGTDPSRLAGRYLQDAVRFPPILVNEWMQCRRSISPNP